LRIVVIGAGVGGLAAAMRLAQGGHDVLVLEQAGAPGGKCARVSIDGHVFDSGPSLLTMPQVFEELFADTGAPLSEEVELMRVEPVTRYRFADGSGFDMSADEERARSALEQWSPGAGADWSRFLRVCEGMWRASQPFLTGPPPWPPRVRGRRGDSAAGQGPPGALPASPPVAGVRPDPRDLLRVKPWRTLGGLARTTCRDPRLRQVVERFATYGGADPRRAPAVLALAGYVEHAFGAWHVRGGLYELVRGMERRLVSLGGELRLETPVRRIARGFGRVRAVDVDDERIPCDAVVCNADALALERDLLDVRPRPEPGERSLSGFALMLGLSGRIPGLTHHTILFPADYGAEFDDVFRARRPVRDPTIYLSAPGVTEAGEVHEKSGEGAESLFLLVNAPSHGDGVDWDAEAGPYQEWILRLLGERGLDVRDRIEVAARRTPADLERETGAPGGAIYGAAPHGRLASLRRPGNFAQTQGLYRVGGTTHPGGGLPLVALSGKIVAEAIGPARR
jgi:phytoene dehydrogenase-like protein